MENMINDLKTPLCWEFKKKKAFLKSDDKTVLELKVGKKRASFKSGDITYTIRNKGFWNPSTVIEEDKKNIAILKRFFRGNTSWIEFENGNKYLLRCKNLMFIKLSVYSSDHKEILRYKLISKYKAVMNLYKNNTEIPGTDMLFLLMLSCFIFRGIIKENKTTDLESVVFSNAVPEKESALTEPV
ncbi:MAG: hypothetical protein ABI855_01795 [Bacteroidota bacterium]